MMIDKGIMIIKKVIGCDNEKHEKCIDNVCKECEHSYTDEELVFVEKHLTKWLEELKEYRKIGTIEELENSVIMIEKAYEKGRADAIDEFQEWLKTQIVGIDNTTKEILVVVDDRWCLETDVFKKHMKEGAGE